MVRVDCDIVGDDTPEDLPQFRTAMCNIPRLHATRVALDVGNSCWSPPRESPPIGLPGCPARRDASRSLRDGHEISSRGRIKEEIASAYQAAHA